MRIQSLRNALMATTGISLALLTGVGAWSLLGGSSELPEVSIPPVGRQPPTKPVAGPNKQPQSFDSLWNLALQGPRNELAKQTVAPTIAPPTTPSFGIMLVGTVIEANKSLALFRDGLGYFDMKGVGEPLELTPAGAQVANIEPGLATVRYEGRDVRLELAAGTMPTALSPGYPGQMPGMQPMDENSMIPTEPEPGSMMMTPMSPGDALPTGEEDIFAPLPQHLNPYSQPPGPAPSTLMEARP